MSGKDGNADKEVPSSSRKTQLLGARALLSRQLNNTSPSPGRLPSLRPARDLTLGATPTGKLSFSSTPKRTFTPNIPTRRIKQEPKEESAKSPGRSEERRRQDGGRGRGRGEGRGRGRGHRGKPNIIQASSVFSMGVGPVEKQRIGQGSSIPDYGASGTRDSHPGVKIKKEGYNMGNDDEEESRRVLKMLETSGDINDDMDSESGIMPVQLPLSFHAVRMNEKQAESATMQDDMKVKSELMDVDSVDSGKAPPLETMKKPVKQVAVKKETQDEANLSSLLSATSMGEHKLLFFQFPDVMPIRPPPNNQDEPMTTEGTSSEQAATSEKSKEPQRLSLKNASEGYIGKLQLLRSGKARLLLGDVALDVTMGTPCGFLQDVVAVHTEDDRSEMVCLGHTNHRLICTPDFEHLLSAS